VNPHQLVLFFVAGQKIDHRLILCEDVEDVLDLLPSLGLVAVVCQETAGMRVQLGSGEKLRERKGLNVAMLGHAVLLQVWVS
jgi:hypothetical protein